MLPEQTKNDFPIFSQLKDLTYLDNAATTQKPAAVIDSISHYYTHFNANVGRGIYDISVKSHEANEMARETMRQFINAPSGRNIVFTKGTTESINYIAQVYAKKRVKANDEIVITGMEHHSNLLPWQMICEETGAKLRVVHVDDNGRISLNDFHEALNPNTKFVAIAHVSNVLGIQNPVKEMIKAAHEKNIPVLLDGAQAVAHMKVDVQDLDADFYCFSGHKMYGPMGIGVLYVRDDHIEELNPFQTGGGVAYGVNYEMVTDYMPAPYRFEAGTPNVAGAIGIAEAAKYLMNLGFDKVQDHEETLFAKTTAKLENINGIEIVGDDSDSRSIISFNIKDIHPYDVGNHLNSFGIAVRTGVHCAIPFVDSLGMLGTVRLSFGVYNTAADVELLCKALESVKPAEWTKERPDVRYMF